MENKTLLKRARETLASYCDWLNSVEPRKSWYKNSYGIRTLVAGYRLLGKQVYLDAAEKLMDRFVSQQSPCGGFNSNILVEGKPISQWTHAEIDSMFYKGYAFNIADVSSMVSSLIYAYPDVDSKRKANYLAAAKRYADEWASQFILETGAFPEGVKGGIYVCLPYSVSTALTGMDFAGLYAITGNKSYLNIATKAATFLLDNWNEDGRPIHWNYNIRKPRSSVYDVTAMGDVLYYNEGILWVYHHSKDLVYKAKVKQVYNWYINGSQGLLAKLEGSWWPHSLDTWRHRWHAAKSAAAPHILINYYNFMEKDPSVYKAIESMIEFLCTPSKAKEIGIMQDPKTDLGDCVIEATGFGGLALAEYIQPGIIFDVGLRKRIPRYINFQPPFLYDKYGLVPLGYERADWSPYDDLKGFGWDSKETGHVPGWAISRGVHSDRRLDTFVYNVTGNWEISLPNGDYLVTLSCGDPSNARTHRVAIQGIKIFNRVQTKAGEFTTINKRPVTISDGKLVVSILDGGLFVDTKGSYSLEGSDITTLNYIDIEPVD